MYQQKGYKSNEYRQFLNEQAFKFVMSWTELLFVALALAEFYVFQEYMTDLAIALFYFVIILFWFAKPNFYQGKQIKKPLVFTERMKRLSLTSIALFAVIPILWLALPSPLIDRFYPNQLAFSSSFIVLNSLFVSFFVLLAGYINAPYEAKIHQGFIRKAQQKIKALPHLKTIAVTGSYGKTSVKFILQAILRTRYQVCYTPGSFNTPMGICKVINNDLNASHQILILEMGARYVGNIEELTQIARPQLSIVTNVGFAHLETFGSQDAIANTKGAIVRALQEGETAVLNADDPRVTQMGQDQPIKRVLCGIETGDIQATNIRYGTKGCTFDVLYEGETYPIATPLLGKHNVTNFLQAFAVGLAFGIRPETMARVAAKLEPTEHRLQLKPIGDRFIIDDAFNSNPVGARNAVDILNQFESGKRYLVTPGMVELGEREYQENFEWGQYIGQTSIDAVLLVGRKRTRPIQEGLAQAAFPNERIQLFDSLNEANAWINARQATGDVILYENDLPDSYNE